MTTSQGKLTLEIICMNKKHLSMFFQHDMDSRPKEIWYILKSCDIMARIQDTTVSQNYEDIFSGWVKIPG